MEKRKTAEDLLKDANELIRSFASIAGRNGKETNWDSLKRRIEEVLDVQHYHIFGRLALDPDQKADEEPRDSEARMRRIEDPQWYQDKSVTDALDKRSERKNSHKPERKLAVAPVDGGLTTDRDDPELHESKDNGQNKKYIVLSEEERAKGFVRPYCDAYEHVGRRVNGKLRELTEEERERYAKYEYAVFEEYEKSDSPVTGTFITKADYALLRTDKNGNQYVGGCGATTTMSRAIAETYARDPKFYGATFCTTCGKHKPVGENGEFIWERHFHNDEIRRVGA